MSGRDALYALAGFAAVVLVAAAMRARSNGQTPDAVDLWAPAPGGASIMFDPAQLSGSYNLGQFIGVLA